MTSSSKKKYRAIAKKYGTPLYVYDAQVIRERCRSLKRHFPGAVMHYACKANANPAVVRIIKEEGFGIETVSAGELSFARKLGFQKSLVSFTCSNITNDELRKAAESAGHVHLDSLHQIELWRRAKLGKDISLRLNHGIGAGHHAHVITGGPDSKFGISLDDLPAARKLAKRYGLRITGLAQHIGSNVLLVGIFARAMQKLLDTALGFPEIRHLDFGGGFGIPYQPTEKELDLAALGREFASRTRAFAHAHGKPVTFAFEPGRFPVAEAGTLLVEVTDIKRTSKHLFIGVNSGFNHLIRPAMYGSYHSIENLSRSGGLQKDITIAGNVCESGDLFAIHRKMSVPHIGDILAIRNAGAYGMSMASHYNQRPLPREIIIGHSRVQESSV